MPLPAFPDDARARAVAAIMIAQNPVFQFMGVEILRIAPGRSHMRMTVRPEHGNSHGVTHGGMIFTFADICLGFAANAHDVRMVIADCDIRFLAPVPIGSALEGVAEERWRKGRTAHLDCTLIGSDGTIHALARARASEIGGRWTIEV